MRVLKFLKNKWARTSLTVVAMAISGSVVAQPMSGTYTVCASGCYFVSPQSVVSSLYSRGVSGAVVLDLKKEVFGGEFIIDRNIAGVSASNTITFQGQGDNSVIGHTYSITTARPIYLRRQSHIEFKDLLFWVNGPNGKYGAITLDTCNNIKLFNCTVEAKDEVSFGFLSYALALQQCTNVEVRNCRLHYAVKSIIINSTNNTGNHKIINNSIAYFLNYGLFFSGSANDEIIGNKLISNQSVVRSQMHYEKIVGGGFRIEGNICNGDKSSNAIVWRQETDTVHNPSYIINNMFGNTFTSSSNAIKSMAEFDVKGITKTIDGKLNIWHNTFAVDASYWYSINTAVSLIISKSKGISFRNNNLYARNAGTCLAISSIENQLDIRNNNYYSGWQDSAIRILGKDADRFGVHEWRDYLGTKGIDSSGEKGEQVSFKGSYDLHIDSSKNGAPYCPLMAEVPLDMDGQTRCGMYTTVGADDYRIEAYSPLIAFDVPSQVYQGGFNKFYNQDNSKVKFKKYKWYIDGIYASDSAHLATLKLSKTMHVISLVREACAGKDTLSRVIYPSLPTKIPVTEFTVDKQDIGTGDEVHLSDISKDGPTQWNWSITPKEYLEGSTMKPTYEITRGALNSPELKIRFLRKGKYEVCLATSNIVGSAGALCHVDLVRVVDRVNIGSIATVEWNEGELYDDGGPDGIYSTVIGSVKRTVIQPCVDSVFFRVKSFDMRCPNDYLRAWESNGDTTKTLHSCTVTPSQAVEPRWSGRLNLACPGYKCYPDTTVTYKAAYSVLFEQSNNTQALGSTYQGFAIEWWSKPRTYGKPKAKIEAADEICRGETATFRNVSEGKYTQYYWDLDGDLSTIESDSATFTEWPFWVAGQYTITLIAENCVGRDTFRKVINVVEPPQPKSAFEADNVNPSVGDYVFLKSTIIECVTEHLWSISRESGTGTVKFENGTSIRSENPVISFDGKGVFSVVLYAANANGNNLLLKRNYITVKDAYCTPSINILNKDVGISKVEIGTISNESPQADTAYADYSKMESISTMLEHGGVYAFTIERKTNLNLAIRTIFIDWNGDGKFDGVGETAANEVATDSLKWKSFITVPKTAKVGATKMRVAIDMRPYPNKPCGQNMFGEYEDYRVYVVSDKGAPILKVTEPDTIFVEVFEPIKRHWLISATDSVEGDISSKVQVSIDTSKFATNILDTFEILYSVSNMRSRLSTAKRWIVVRDTVKPTIRLRGQDSVKIQVGDMYVDAGVDVSDNYYSEDHLRQKGLTVINLVHVTEPGFFEVRYRLRDGSGNEAPMLVRTVRVDSAGSSSISAQQEWSKAVTIYPNPNNGRFNVNVDLPAGERVRMVVLDAMGRQVRVVEDGRTSGSASNSSQNNYEVDMNGASAGVYLLQVTGANYSFVKRIVVQK